MVALGGGLVKSLQTAELTGPGAEMKVRGVVFGTGRQRFDHHTFLDHMAANTMSDLDFRTVCDERERSAYTGRLRIVANAPGCDAHQTNHNLLLSAKARADTIPELEILTHDVTCSHAATVGPLDQDQLYYCQSRGFSPEEARRTIVMGFLEQTIARVPTDDVREGVRQVVDRRLMGTA